MMYNCQNYTIIQYIKERFIMHCTNCGAELEAGAKFCTSCGSRVEEAAPAAAPATEAPAVETPATETATAEAPAEKKDASADIVGKAKDFFGGLWAKIKPSLKKADEKAGELLGDKKNYAYIGVLALLGVIIVISVIAGMIPESNGFLTVEYTEPAMHDDNFYLFKEGKLIEIKSSAESVRDSDTSIDGKVILFKTGDDELYQIKGKKTLLIAEDVTDFNISLYGDSVVFNSVDEIVITYYYCKLGKEPVEIFENEVDSVLTSYAISPDGKSVVYTASDGLDSDLYYFNGKESEKIGGCNGTVISTSNGGKYIYASVLDEDLRATLYCFNKKGEKTKIDSVSSKNYRLNLDCTEIMFYDDGRTYISVKGKEPVKAASAELRLILPRYTSSKSEESCTVYPIDSLYNHAYSGGGNLYFVSKSESKNVKLANTDGDIFLDDSAEYIYYMDDEALMCLKISHGSNAKDKAKEIAEDVEDYVVTSDRKYVYFVSDDSVCVTNGKKGGKPKTLSSDDTLGGLEISMDDIVYYISDDTLYGIKGRSKGKKIMDDGDYINLGGYVYLSDGDSIFEARGTGKPKKLIDVD